jgi:hypothetical protein
VFSTYDSVPAPVLNRDKTPTEGKPKFNYYKKDGKTYSTKQEVKTTLNGKANLTTSSYCTGTYVKFVGIRIRGASGLICQWKF